MGNNMTCQSVIGSKVGLGPSIAAPNQTNQAMDSQQITKFAKNMTTKAPKYHHGKAKFEERWYLLV